MPRFLIIWVFLLLFNALYSAPNVIVFSDSSGVLRIDQQLSYVTDETGNLSLDSVLFKNGFKEHSGGIPNFGISKATQWIRFSLRNISSSERLLLEVDQATINYAALYVEFEGEIFSQEKLGTNFPYFARKYNHQNFLFDLYLPAGTEQTYYLEVRSSHPLMLPLYVGKKEQVLESLMNRDLVFGIYIGIILVMFFYNIFIFFSVQDKSYLVYVFYILIVGLIQGSLSGYNFRLLWPASPWLASQSIVLFPAIGGIMAIEFLKVFTHTREVVPKLHRFFILFHGFFSLCIVLSLAGFNHLANTLIQPSAMFASFYMITAAVIMIRRGSRAAYFFLSAWLLFLFGIILYILKDIGVAPYNTFTVHVLEIGSALEVILLSFGLADKINILRKEKEASQREAFHSAQENERIVLEQNIILEAKVNERTAELKKANDDLNLAMMNLKEAQSQLVSAEKMASLGQLTAGIAHEINNPINFVTSNIDPLQQNIKELLQLIARQEKLAEAKSNEIEAAIKDVNTYKKQIDLPYLIEETNDIILGIKEGATRTADIVLGLRTFSHVDDIGLKLVDINKGIESTLKLLKGELTKDIDVELELGTIPDLECYGGKINQVFMNVINNAIHAVKDSPEQKGKIRIVTEDLIDGVKVTISDNGIGMTEETRTRMFEPFFTTKEVGKGTGLGLSVVYGIIESHHGTVKVESQIGIGTTFVINLPYVQPN